MSNIGEQFKIWLFPKFGEYNIRLGKPKARFGRAFFDFAKDHNLNWKKLIRDTETYKECQCIFSNKAKSVFHTGNSYGKRNGGVQGV